MPDIRNHPAINYYKSGLPIVLAGDDPGSFGYNELTVEYYLVFMGWGLGLYDLREIANNSIRYSSVPKKLKFNGYNKFQEKWNFFIEETYYKMCNSANFDLTKINMERVFPSYGPDDKSIKISIYGSGYENLFCKKIKCLFNDSSSNGYLNKLDELICETPANSVSYSLAKLSISFDDIIFRTNLTFKFVPTNFIKIIFD